MLAALEAGAEDIVEDDAVYEIYTSPQGFGPVQKALATQEIPVERAELTRVPQNTVPVEGSTAERLIRLLETLESQDDVQRVYTNFEMDEEELSALISP